MVELVGMFIVLEYASSSTGIIVTSSFSGELAEDFDDLISSIMYPFILF